MKILWLVNIVMPELAEHLGLKPTVFGGWLIGAMNAVRKAEHDLVVCTTMDDPQLCGRYDVKGVTYYIVRKGSLSSMQTSFHGILECEQPDVVHLYGTEFEQSWALASQTDPDKTLVSVQGLVSFYAEHVFGGVPEKIARDNLLHRMLRRIHKGGTSIELQRQSYLIRAKAEIDTLKRVRYVNGGTSWGDNCARLLHPDVKLLPGELILRDSFYDGRVWNPDKMEPHSIFTIYGYPIKGFDMFLHGLKWIVQRYPDTHVYVAGNSCAFRNYRGLRKKILDLAPDYDWYVQGLIEQYGLKDHITFQGYLSEDEMHERLLRSNVFVSAASIENHCTSLCEALLTGVPCVASCVGGLQDLIEHGKGGFLYPFNETYSMASYVCRVFEDPELAKTISQKGHEHAARTFDKEQNCRELLNMYKIIHNNKRSDLLETKENAAMLSAVNNGFRKDETKNVL